MTLSCAHDVPLDMRVVGAAPCRLHGIAQVAFKVELRRSHVPSPRDRRNPPQDFSEELKVWEQPVADEYRVQGEGTGIHVDAQHENPSRHLERGVIERHVECLFRVAPALTRPTLSVASPRP